MAEPILLPVLSSERYVRLPPAPRNPPNTSDITNAIWLTSDLANARRRDEVTDNDVCNGALYHHKLISAKAAQGGDVPPWFAEALRQALEPIDKKINKLSNDPDVNEKIDKLTNVTNDLNRKIDNLTNVTNNLTNVTNNMNDKVDKLTNDVDDLKTDVQSLKKTQEHIKRLSAILYNRSRGSGDDTALEVVPFENASISCPTGPDKIYNNG